MRDTLHSIERIVSNKGYNRDAIARDLMLSGSARPMLAAIGWAVAIRLYLQYEDRDIGTALLLPSEKGARFEKIIPGKYTLAMATGRVLWERVLTVREVISKRAWESDGFPAAAQTDSFDPKPTLAEKVAEGALWLSVYAGRESGGLQCVLNTKP